MDSPNQMNAAPQGSSTPMQNMNVEKDGGRGALIGTIIIIVLLAIAGVYAWQTHKPQESAVDQNIVNEPDASLDSLNQTSSSDDLNSIEADAANTEFDTLDSDFGDIDAEVNSIQ